MDVASPVSVFSERVEGGMMLETKWISSEEIAYTGHELRPHFILRKFGIRGSALVAFVGPCRVQTDEMVDWEDRLEGDRIESRRMLHFMGEFFTMPLTEGVLRQRLMIAAAAEMLPGCRRSGNDLYVGDRKLSVSIVTASPVSLLLHFGVNLDPTGAPVQAVGLDEMGVKAEDFALRLLDAVAKEFDAVQWACAKVRPVLD